MRLIKSQVDALACPPGKRDVMVFDDELRGFAVRVTSAGTKTYVLQYRHGDAVHRLVLGRHGEITPVQARRLAEQGRGRIAAGGHPVAEKASRLAAEQAAKADRKRAGAANALTLERLVDQWVATALKDRSAVHRREAPAALARCLAAMWKQPAHAITAAAAQSRIDAIGARTPTMASRVRAYARAAFTWAGKRGLITHNPFASVAIEAREVSRDRVLTDAELGALWNATGRLAYPFGPMLRVLLLTLQRRSEVAGMRWSELALARSLWTIPATRAKNRKAHLVHLSAPARQILDAVPHRADSDLVFTTTGRTAVSGFSRSTEVLRELVADEIAGADAPAAAAAAGWRLHDFRRTGVTALAGLGVAPHVADRLLNHVEGTISGVAAVYQRHEFPAERQAALDLWAAHVLEVAAVATGEDAAEP